MHTRVKIIDTNSWELRNNFKTWHVELPHADNPKSSLFQLQLYLSSSLQYMY
ncbi:MAG: hypothetical protein WC656_03535 [Sulfurimonas sp.]